jgi:hypothetical protein
MMIARAFPRKSAVIVRLERTIRYAAPCVLTAGAGDYWMPACAGMTINE